MICAANNDKTAATTPATTKTYINWQALLVLKVLAPPCEPQQTENKKPNVVYPRSQFYSYYTSTWDCVCACVFRYAHYMSFRVVCLIRRKAFEKKKWFRRWTSLENIFFLHLSCVSCKKCVRKPFKPIKKIVRRKYGSVRLNWCKVLCL